ncbi:MAG: toll/interleukin-1 receptor domain-containing protein [Bryobacteraceae bacterium]
MKGPPARVFLSYASQDRERVARLYDNLKAAGFNPWMDFRDIPKGQDWQPAIQDAIRQSEVFVACISEQSVVKSGVLQGEIDHALEARQSGKRLLLLPVRLDATAAPKSLSHIQWVDLTADDNWREVAAVIRKEMSRIIRRKWLKIAFALAVLLGAALYAAVQFLPKPPPVVAVDILRLRRWQPGDPESARFVLNPTPHNGLREPSDMMTEKIGLGEELSVSDLVIVRLMSSRPGYVQVIDQELAPDPGRPLALSIDQRIEAGKPLDLPPSEKDQSSYIRFESSNSRYAGERLSIVVTPAPLSPRIVSQGGIPVLDSAAWAKWQPWFPATPPPAGPQFRQAALPPGAKEMRIETASAVHSSAGTGSERATALRLSLRVHR